MRTSNNLLLIGDNPALVQMLEIFSQQTGDQVHIVPDVDSAFTTWEADQALHLIMVATTEAASTCASLKTDGRFATIPLVAVVIPDESLVAAAFRAGASECLTVPVVPSLLNRCLCRLLESSVRPGAVYTYTYLSEFSTNEERLQLALEAADDGLWDWNLTTGEIYFSPSWMRMLGYSPDQIEGTLEAWQAIIHPDDLPGVTETINRHLADRVPVAEFQYRIRTRGGKWLWVQARGRVMIRDREGRPQRMMGTQKNIDRLKTTEDALRESEERHRIISNMISDYAYAYAVNDGFSLNKEWSTQAFYEITGYTVEEMDGDGWSRIIHPEDFQKATVRFERLLRGEPDITEFRIITKSGEVRWLRDHGQPIVDPGSGRVTHIYGAAQDITQRKRDEEMLHRQAAELAARNEELDAFAYTVAHDLKNPISSMMGFASLVQNYYDRMDDERIKEYLALIMEGGYKLKSIINALLLLAGVSKMEQASVEPLDMQIIVEDAKKRLAVLIEETRGRITLPVEMPVAAGYGPWVEEIWMNYLSNALKYGGNPPEIEIGAEPTTNGMVRFWVRDNGSGLTDEEKLRVFTPFTRLNHVKVEGHGLGLSVVERIVKKLGGEVGVESKVGQGSVFSFTLPQS